jgi:hypothetical protein
MSCTRLDDKLLEWRTWCFVEEPLESGPCTQLVSSDFSVSHVEQIGGKNIDGITCSWNAQQRLGKTNTCAWLAGKSVPVPDA